MSLKQQKIDVTDRIIGKLKNGSIQLFLENEKIGELSLPEGSEIQLEHHFEGNQNQIFQHVTTTTGPDMKYTDCEDGGWC